MDTEVRLAELLCTRLCHDLTGPIGAVNNGAEFLGEEGFALQDQAIELIIGSAQQAVTRLQFYRQSYGRVNSQGEASLSEVRELAEAFFRDSRFELSWPDVYTDSSEVSLSRKMAKLVLNMLILISGAMPRGGKLAVILGQQEGTGYVEVRVRGEGEGVREDEESINALKKKTKINDLTPKSIQPYFMARLADSLGVTVSHSISATYFEMVAVHP
jgi:histidine phosphotransferase ChpT